MNGPNEDKDMEPQTGTEVFGQGLKSEDAVNLSAALLGIESTLYLLSNSMKQIRSILDDKVVNGYIPITIRAEQASAAIPEQPTPDPSTPGGPALPPAPEDPVPVPNPVPVPKPVPAPAPVPLPVPTYATLHTIKAGVPHTLSPTVPDRDVYQVTIYEGDLQRNNLGWLCTGAIALDPKYFSTGLPINEVNSDAPSVPFTLKKRADLDIGMSPLVQVVVVIQSKTYKEKRGFAVLAVEG